MPRQFDHVLCFVNNGLADKAQHRAWASVEVLCRWLKLHLRCNKYPFPFRRSAVAAFTLLRLRFA